MTRGLADSQNIGFKYLNLKPWQCKFCNYLSERKGNVCLHVKKVHKKDWTNGDIIVHRDILETQNKMVDNDINIIAMTRDDIAPILMSKENDDE